MIQASIDAYKQPNYLTMVAYRLGNEVPITLLNLIFVIIKILGLFTIGYAIGKMNIFNKIKENLIQIRRFFMLTAALSLIIIFGYVFAMVNLKNPQVAVFLMNC